MTSFALLLPPFCSPVLEPNLEEAKKRCSEGSVGRAVFILGTQTGPNAHEDVTFGLLCLFTCVLSVRVTVGEKNKTELNCFLSTTTHNTTITLHNHEHFNYCKTTITHYSTTTSTTTTNYTTTTTTTTLLLCYNYYTTTITTSTTTILLLLHYYYYYYSYYTLLLSLLLLHYYYHH